MALELFDKIKRQGSEILIERELQKNKGELGILLYDEVVKSFQYEGVVAADEDLLKAVQADYIEIHREVAALLMKRDMLKKKEQEKLEKLSQVEDEESPKKERIPGVLWNKAKNKAELFVIDQNIQELKRQFGVRAYEKLEALEEEKNWKPSELKLQTTYIKCRQNVRKLEAAKERARTEVDLVHEVAAAVVTLSEEAPADEPQDQKEVEVTNGSDEETGPITSSDISSPSESQPGVDSETAPISAACSEDTDIIEEKKTDTEAPVEDSCVEKKEESPAPEAEAADSPPGTED